MSGAVPFIVNLRARRAGRWPEVASRLDGLGVAVRPVLVADPAEWTRRVAEQARARPPLLLLGGGDGSHSRALAPLVGSGIAIGFVPLGTGNGIARSFGMGSPAEACRAIAAGRRAPAGVGRANAAYFLNMASFGISVAVTQGLHPGLKRWTGRGAYPLSVLRAVLGRRPFDLELALPGGQLALPATQVIIFNGRYHAAAPGVIRPGRSLTVCALGRLPLARLLLAGLGFLAGVQPGRLGILCREATRLTLATDPPLPVNVDGEIVERTPLDVALLPDALLVVTAGQQ